MQEKFLQRALALAKQAEQQGEVPVGAVVVFENEIVGEGFNQPISSCDPMAHAEIIALRQAAKHLKNYRLSDCDLYVTLQPCVMCASAMVHARIKQCYFGAHDSRDPAEPNHKVVTLGGFLEQECSDLLRNFFKQRRK